MSTLCQMTPSHNEKMEWSRMAMAAYGSDRNDVGHRFSAYASLRSDESIDIRTFDALQNAYRNWLCFNEFPTI